MEPSGEPSTEQEMPRMESSPENGTPESGTTGSETERTGSQETNSTYSTNVESQASTTPSASSNESSSSSSEQSSNSNSFSSVDSSSSNESNTESSTRTMTLDSVSVSKAPPPEAYEQPFDAQGARTLAMNLIHKYFTTQTNALTSHHIDSYDQFVSRDLAAIVRAHNPILLLKNPKDEPMTGNKLYKYSVEIYIGGLNGDKLYIGTPTIALENGKDTRLLFPNEARLRNLTYALQIEADIFVRVGIRTASNEYEYHDIDISNEGARERIPLCSLPLMLHSKYCLLHNKPPAMLQQMGECTQDEGGYFVIDGSEKVLVTRQEGSFNTLWIDRKNLEPAIELKASLASLNPKTREVKRINFFWTRARNITTIKGTMHHPSVLEVSIPFVMKPVPICILFRAMGVQTDKDILQLMFPDLDSPEAKLLAEMMVPSFSAAAPFLDTYSAIIFIKELTKGFSVEHVLDIVHNHLFPHVENTTQILRGSSNTTNESGRPVLEDLPKSRVMYLADCVRRILRVAKGLDQPPSRDDTRNQRLLSSGFLLQLLFQQAYKTWVKLVKKTAEEMYAYNETVYSDLEFLKIFGESNQRDVFAYNHISKKLMSGFKGKWMTGPVSEESGIVQEMSRLSYLDFMSHLRRVVLNFDTSLKLQGPRRLNTSQYGYFCTSETPTGSHIGVTKNLSICTKISTGCYTDGITKWLVKRGFVIPCDWVTAEIASLYFPVLLNRGLIGYTKEPIKLARILRLCKRSGFLPPLSSSGFSIPERTVYMYFDDGRPLRPLIICEPIGHLPVPSMLKRNTWRDFVVGSLRPDTEIGSREFVDPLADKPTAKFDDYLEFFKLNQEKLAVIEYLDPDEQNEALLANVPEHVVKQTTHMEVHPSTILGLLGNMIPYPNHNQSPRNQLSASQSKQGISLYATNWFNRFDNTANVLCYGQAPICRTYYQDYVGHGQMPYGQNIILAMGVYGGYNQEDGIIMNADALARGQFRSLNYRSYEAFEGDEENTKYRIGNPREIPPWTDVNNRLDYSKLDEQGIVKEGSYVDQNTVIVGRYILGERGTFKDASVTPQVWTRGRVEKVVVMVNNMGFRLVKVRIVQDRVPELGDKYSNRHGQKGTINVLYRAQDMPRTAEGITPDMIMNPSAIPSRMTIGQMLEMMFGVVASELGAIANVTAFMNDGSPHELLGSLLEKLGLNKMCNTVLYNGMTGEQMEADIYMGVVYGMRLKHMTEDKWNARGQGRKEQRTHQPTGGRGNEGGMKIGEMERDAILGHAIANFQMESYMERSDGTTFIVCNGCGTIPLYNERKNFYLCPMCDGPIQFSGDTPSTLEPILPPTRSSATFSKIRFPYSSKLFFQEMAGLGNYAFRILTERDATRLIGLEKVEAETEVQMANLEQPLKPFVYTEFAPGAPPEVELPTAADIEKTLQQLTQEVIRQNDVRGPQTQLQAQQAPQNVLGSGNLNAFFALPQPQPQIQTQQANQPELAPGSIQPAPLPNGAQPLSTVPMPTSVFEQSQRVPPVPSPAGPSLLAPIPLNQYTQAQLDGNVVATTQEGAPVISIDTSDDALRTAGLVQPSGNVPMASPGRPFTVAPQQAFPSRPRTFRRPASRPPSQQPPAQMGGYDSFYGQGDPYGSGETPPEEEHAPQSSGAPLQVIKLG
jgi:DNA-directed RNA polymerase II subunit RPB2